MKNPRLKAGRRTIAEDIILGDCTSVSYADAATHEHDLVDTLDELGMDGQEDCKVRHWTARRDTYFVTMKGGVSTKLHEL